MFKMTVVASKLREQMASYLAQVKGTDVLQILHRGDSVKVMMTQEHYLSLISRLSIYEKNEFEKTVPHQSGASVKAALKEKLQKLEPEEEQRNDSSRVGRVRARTT